MEERRSWEYPECEHVFDFGVHGLALPGMFKHTRTPRRRQAAVLSPVIFDIPPTVYIYLVLVLLEYMHMQVEKPVNEFQLGVDVSRMVDEEIAKEYQRPKPWRNCLGVVHPPGFASDLMARPQSAPLDDRVIMEEASKDMRVMFEALVSLEGTDGLISQLPMGSVGLDHPVQTIACGMSNILVEYMNFADYTSGGMVVLEDYAVSTYWPNEDCSLMLNTMRRESMLTIHAAVSPFKRECVVSFEDESIVHSGENLEVLHLIKGKQYDQVAWGNASNVFYSNADTTMNIFDLRILNHEIMVCEADAKLYGICGPHRCNDLIVTHNPDYLTIFDLRMLPTPALRISRNRIGCRNFSWMSWLDSGMFWRAVFLEPLWICVERLAILSTDAVSSQIYVASDLHTGRPVVDCIRVEQKPRGLSVASDGRLFCLFDDLSVSSWSIDELLDSESIGASDTHLEPDYRPSVDAENHDHRLTGNWLVYTSPPQRHVEIYESRQLSSDSLWPSIRPPPKLPVLKGAAHHLTKYWPMEENL